MLRTIMIGSSIFIQGTYVKTLPDGRMTVRVDGNVFSGKSISAAA